MTIIFVYVITEIRNGINPNKAGSNGCFLIHKLGSIPILKGRRVILEKKVNLLSAQKICKSFGKNNVLKSVDFDLEAGEVHALIGENGAGKSTLLKILFGIYQPTSGEIYLDGKTVRMKHPVDAIGHGIAMIHQEPSVFEDLSIAENIFTGHFDTRKIKWEELNRKASEAMQEVGLAFSPGRMMKGLSVAEQQLIEIASALSSDAKIIFMDEPTASLTPSEVDNLLELIDTLRKKGKTIVYISHRLEEIKAVSDRITVLRDGEIVGTYQNAEITKDQIIQKMIGREFRAGGGETERKTFGQPFLEIEDISIPGIFEHISFQIARGEIMGVAGLMGAGRTEVARGIFGITPVKSGQIKIKGKEVKIGSPEAAIINKIALVPEDRQGLGLFVSEPIAFNTTFAIIDSIKKKLGYIDTKKEKKISEEYVEGLKTKCRSVNQKVGDLSGGNQQKVSLAKWISTNPDVLILDEPTRGIDVGAKEEVYRLIRKLAEEGKCIMMISSELNEIISLSDKVMVMYEGKQTGMLQKDEITDVKILSAAHDCLEEAQ
ncbi:sugar ABC transporter ATP-binding protein [Hungatella hathewayi]|uniref:Autoinducer 2 import ATP-binding protein LsrA n=1 Tax=Hungatella hathewayi TaxID=154046 RepID=A0A3E2WR70_9FIRM|nr:sugar ABC transporter ATP-binding protein [Faecalicatena contorta]RGC29842.1 sugar ABC transporter ATP-binding protein [Hungatella hathewayi]